VSPVYWKPSYGSRSSRHRAWAKRQAAREEALKHAGGPTFREWLGSLFRRKPPPR
jgi:hypothetical protein